MNAIAKALISKMYPELNISAIMEVINATPNPELATEILCGLYEEVTPNPISHQRTLTSYEKWTDTVHYEYQVEETKHGYFPLGTKKEDVTLENFDVLQVPYAYKEQQESFAVTTGKMVTRTGTTSFEQWQNAGFAGGRKTKR